MPATALPENYCVCVGEDGAPREIGRSGTAVTYKAMGYQSGQPVALQLIPLANVSDVGRAQFELKVRAVRKLRHPNIARIFDVRVEDDHIVFATEYLRGETAEAWVMMHGPMPPDAAVRIALQVVSALAEAAFHSLSHRSIQPSNLFILNGDTADGDWPFVKLINFGLAGLKLYSEGTDEIAPPIAPAFASPEQSGKGKVDFRSEIFSLGATLCFLLTGAVPLPGRARRSGPGERVLPAPATIPRPLRRLLRRMLLINPDERPHDPLLLTDELQRCLGKLKPRRVATVEPVAPVSVETPAPNLRSSATIPEPIAIPIERERPQFLTPILTAATMLLLGAALLVVLLPGQVHWWTHRNRPLESIGVPIGVPDEVSVPAPSVASKNVAAGQNNSAPVPLVSAAATVAPSPPVLAHSSPLPTSQPTETPAPAVTQQSDRPSLVVTDTSTPAPVESAPESPAPVADNRMAEPPPPQEAPPATAEPASALAADEARAVAQQPRAMENDELTANSSPATSSPPAPPAGAQVGDAGGAVSPPPPEQPASSGKTSNEENAARSVRTTRSTPTSSAGRSAPSPGPAPELPQMRVGGAQARLVGTTENGQWILRLASGRTVVTPPLPKVNEAPVISRRRVRRVLPPPRALPVDDRAPVVVLPPD